MHIDHVSPRATRVDWAGFIAGKQQLLSRLAVPGGWQRREPRRRCRNRWRLGLVLVTCADE